MSELIIVSTSVKPHYYVFLTLNCSALFQLFEYGFFIICIDGSVDSHLSLQGSLQSSK